MDIGDKSRDDYFLPDSRNDIGTLGKRWSEKEKYRSIETLLLVGHQPDFGLVDITQPSPQQCAKRHKSILFKKTRGVIWEDVT
jgi:hypothetical protein